MEPPQRNDVALVTGAGQGIGLGIGRALATAGVRVALTDRDGEAAARAAADLQAEGRTAIGLALDVTRADDWTRAVEETLRHWGRLDVLINNAGISPRGTAEATDESLWDQVQAINVKGPWLGIKATLPWLRRTRGTIVNIGSTLSTQPQRGLCAYCTSKAALLGLTRQVAIEYVDEGVTCNLIAPGWVDTPGERILQARHGRPDFPRGLRNLTAPEEVGAAVLFLISKPGRRLNANILYLDSGQHAVDDPMRIYLPASGSTSSP